LSKKKDYSTIESLGLVAKLVELLPLLRQVYSMCERKEVKGEVVPNGEKIFSIYELHTDIIVKGRREVEFGHKINLANGKGRMILDCQILKGNPADTTLLVPSIDRITGFYETVPQNFAADGGYASLDNMQKAADRGIVNIVFNKVVGKMKNLATSKNMETRLKKFRSGIEATISNFKRGFDIFRCNWKGWENFCSKVFWSVIGYNIRAMTNLMLAKAQ
jgi:IS5 family transposase